MADKVKDTKISEEKKPKMKADKDILKAKGKALTKKEKERKEELLKEPDIAPLAINRHNPTFRKKMWKLVKGIREDKPKFVEEIKQYFAKHNMQLAYNKESDKIRLVAQGAVPVDFRADEFTKKPE